METGLYKDIASRFPSWLVFFADVSFAEVFLDTVVTLLALHVTAVDVFAMTVLDNFLLPCHIASSAAHTVAARVTSRGRVAKSKRTI